MNVRLKLTFISISISAVAVISVAFSLYTRYVRVYADSARNMGMGMLSQMSTNLDIYIDEIYRMTLTPYYSKEIMDLLQTPTPSTLQDKLAKRRAIDNFLNATMIFPRKDIQRVYLVADDSYVSDQYVTLVPSYKEQIVSDWYKKAMELDKAFVVLPSLDDFYYSQSPQTFSVVNTLHNLDGSRTVCGVVKVDANFRAINEMCQTATLDETGGVMLMAEDNSVIFTNLPSERLSEVEEGYLRSGQIKENNLHGDFIIHSAPMKHFGWRLIYVSSLTTVNEQIAGVVNAIIAISLICIAFISIGLYSVISHFLRPFYQIVDIMKEVADGRFSSRYKGNIRNEIGYMGNVLNEMLDSLSQSHERNIALNNSINKANILHREMQLRLLYSQIKPHFIYNTLNMISIQVQQQEPEAAVESINRLSLLLRGIAYIDKDIPLKKEVDLLDAYLAIQRVRYEDHISYSIEIASDLLEMVVPALILQPIVENSVNHAHREGSVKLNINIYSIMENDPACICIEDDGAGIPAAALARLQERLSKNGDESMEIENELSSLKGLGLVNLNTRLRTHFGDEYRITVQSGLNTGTRVYVPLPAKDHVAGWMR
ncbi:MAG: histidine kinase [Clostridiales bacterium]|jgi:two-component system sensor histidine kinase YesM|nr:histidine kinase [Clostridiales bacterium]